MKTFKVVVSGRVQGVGFRYFVYRNAIDLNLKGYVKNTDYRTVESVIQGEVENIYKLIEICKKGTSASYVENVEFNEIVADDYKEFKIEH